MRFIILDRDGVINQESDAYIKSPDEWHPLPGSLEAIAKLNQAGFRVFVATNQSGIGRGLYDLDMLKQIHDKFFSALAAVGGEVEEIFFCPHSPEDRCFCRKPKPGLLVQIQEKYNLNLADTFFIGDSIVDVSAALFAGCQPILVRTGHGQAMLEKYPELLTIRQFANLAEAVDAICVESQTVR